MKEVIPSLISNILYDNKTESKGNNEVKSILNIVIDETHNLLSNSKEETEMHGNSLKTFEKIIKEGRKFGVYLMIASQRPSDISTTITSQLQNYFIHKNIIRDPYVLEFLGLEGKTSFYEKDLEQAIIDQLQKFLLELGRGFSFVSRQQKITFDGRHFFIDLVFYNYILKCLVIIDLKLGDLTHQDIGQIIIILKIQKKAENKKLKICPKIKNILKKL